MNRENTLTEHKNITKALISIAPYFLLQRVPYGTIQSPLCSESALSSIALSIINQCEIDESQLTPYLKQGVANKIRHYSLAQDINEKELFEQLIKLLFKKDRVNFQRYLERCLRHSLQDTIEKLYCFFLQDITQVDLICELKAFEIIYPYLKEYESRIHFISYLSLILTYRTVSIPRVGVLNSRTLKDDITMIPNSIVEIYCALYVKLFLEKESCFSENEKSLLQNYYWIYYEYAIDNREVAEREKVLWKLCQHLQK